MLPLNQRSLVCAAGGNLSADLTLSLVPAGLPACVGQPHFRLPDMSHASQLTYVNTIRNPAVSVVASAFELLIVLAYCLLRQYTKMFCKAQASACLLDRSSAGVEPLLLPCVQKLLHECRV